MCFHNLYQAGALAPGEVHFALEGGDHIERRPVVKMDRSEIGIRREDANPPGKASQMSCCRFILVVLRHINRMEPDGVQPMPNEKLRKRLIEGRGQRNTVLCRVESARLKVSGDNRARGFNSPARISFVIFRLLRSTFGTLTRIFTLIYPPLRNQRRTRG